MSTYIPAVGSFLEETGLLFEINLVVLHKHGLSAAVGPDGRVVLEDHRSEEGGVVYSNEEIRANLKTFIRLQQGNVARITRRQLLLGGRVRQNLNEAFGIGGRSDSRRPRGAE